MLGATAAVPHPRRASAHAPCAAVPHRRRANTHAPCATTATIADIPAMPIHMAVIAFMVPFFLQV